MKNSIVGRKNKMWVTFGPQKAKKVIHVLFDSSKLFLLLLKLTVALAT